jgi:HSP20 family protein
MLTRFSDSAFTRHAGSDTTFAFAALDDFRRRVDELFNEVGFDGATGSMLVDTWPNIDLADQGDRLVLVAEVPGLSQKDIQLELDANRLTLAAARDATLPKGAEVRRKERGSYTVCRSLTLPCAVDPKRAEATVKDGVLTVTLEKAPSAKPRQIAVRTLGPSDPAKRETRS